MKTNISSKFRQMVFYSILAIFLFILVYLILIGLAFFLAIICVKWSYYLVSERISFGSIAIAVALIALGVLVFYFLIKFIFNKHKVDRSHFIEIDESQEPELFRVIHEVVDTVGTQFPKRVYLSSEVNASVFYDSSFWSMFLPIKKNLHIGMGLIQSTTQQEFKAILAHEFGHFSQRSMKVGSYVYNVNQVIYNMLYENDGFDDFISQLSGVNIFFSMTAMLAITIFKGIKWILNKLYLLINLTYMGLSRQMEFHADAIACQIAGSAAMKSALLRLDLSSYALQDAIQFYFQKDHLSFKSVNIFKDQQIVMNTLAMQKNIAFKHDFPLVTSEDIAKQQQTKLNFEDQWASHPTTQQRVDAINEDQHIVAQENHRPSSQLLRTGEALCSVFTKQIFENVNTSEKAILTEEDFNAYYSKNRADYEFHPYFKDYYNYRKLVIDTTINNITTLNNIKESDLYNAAIVEKAKIHQVISNDIFQLKQLKEQKIKLKTFDYDGIKYTKKEADGLMTKLENELQPLEKELLDHDQKVFLFFDQMAISKNQESQYKQCKNKAIGRQLLATTMEEFFYTMVDESTFISQHLAFTVIETKMAAFKKIEEKFKTSLSKVYFDDIIHLALNEELKKKTEEYLNTDWSYFVNDSYIQNNLEKLSFIIQYTPTLLDYYHFKLKKEFLDSQVKLATQ